MYSSFKDAILNPKAISNHINKKWKNFFYLLIISIIMILPTIVETIITGGFGNDFFQDIVDTVRYEEINFKIQDGKLSVIDENADSYKLCSGSSIQVIFTILPSDNSTGINDIVIESSKVSMAPYKFIFTEDKLLFVANMAQAPTIFSMGDYNKLNISNFNFVTDNERGLNDFSKIFYDFYDTVKVKIGIFTVITLIIGAPISFALMLLVPSFLIYIFNRGSNLRFGQIYAMAIYSFTIYALAGALSYGNPIGIFPMICEIISFIYLFKAIKGLYLKGNGGL